MLCFFIISHEIPSEKWSYIYILIKSTSRNLLKSIHVIYGLRWSMTSCDTKSNHCSSHLTDGREWRRSPPTGSRWHPWRAADSRWAQTLGTCRGPQTATGPASPPPTQTGDRRVTGKLVGITFCFWNEVKYYNLLCCSRPLFDSTQENTSEDTTLCVLCATMAIYLWKQANSCSFWRPATIFSPGERPGRRWGDGWLSSACRGEESHLGGGRTKQPQESRSEGIMCICLVKTKT